MEEPKKLYYWLVLLDFQLYYMDMFGFNGHLHAHFVGICFSQKLERSVR